MEEQGENELEGVEAVVEEVVVELEGVEQGEEEQDVEG